MSTLREFERDLDDFSRKVGLEHATVVKRVALDLFGRVVKKTPVDTGRARASWTIAVGAPDRTIQPEGTYPAMQRQGEAGRVAQAMAQQALSGLESLASLAGYVREPIWISNNLPYIEELERGHSLQAPAGMVAISIIEVDMRLEALLRARV